MSWLNEPVEIIEDYRVVYETQDYLIGGSATHRHRTLTTIIYLYVGCDYSGAKAKADSFVGNTDYSDVQVFPVGGGQYHCRAQYTSGEWGAWET